MAKFKNIPEVSTKLFSYNEKNRVFTTEDSDLRANGFRGEQRIYDDACDVGFYLVSEKTGQKILFVHSSTLREDDGHGDVISDTYSAYCLHENPEHLLDLKLVIWND